MIVAVLQQHRLPLTELEIRNSLAQLENIVNKTTVYREMEYLLLKGVATEVDFGDRKKRYELKGKHHHHVVCTNCKKVDEIIIKDDLKNIERMIFRSKHFKITNHTLEFFGLCQKCINN